MTGGCAARSVPIYALPGNHDCPPGGGSWIDFERRWHLQPGMGRSVDTPYARLVLLNAQGHSPEQADAARPGDPVYGWVNDAELARLDDALATAGDLPVILFVHQLLRPWSGDRAIADYYLVANADAVLARMARHGNVRAVFQGHAHRFDVQHLTSGDNPCSFFVCPAIIQYPLGWLAVTLSTQQMRVQLHSLPLPDLCRLALDSGEGQAWRAGRRAWHDFTIAL
jgi:3',5'-cyclic AMP phosphodiesterase CpdA